jgi:arylsulfatase
MRTRKIFLILLILVSLIACNPIEKEQVQPNIIYFFADDLGYGETGVYGQEFINTPNINGLADSGVRFTNHYAGAPVSAPSRYVFLTGQHTGNAYIRSNDEWTERGDVWNYEEACNNSELEGQRPMKEGTITLASFLQDHGYKTGLFGKWGLGAPGSEGEPTKQGFNSFYGYNCQRQAHNLYPPHLWEDTLKVSLNNTIVAPSSKLEKDADPMYDSSYSKFNQNDYAPELIHDKAIEFLEENKDEQFFMYYASPLPHLPLQAPEEFVQSYKAFFGEEEPYSGANGYFPNRTPRATYAAMISYLDYQLGDLISKLKELGIYENTIIIFSSDNGPTYCGGVDFDFFKSTGSLSNGYGRTKGFVYEGGIRVPMIVSWPGKVQPGSISNHVSASYDIFPTICDINGFDIPDKLDGLSFKQALLGENQEEHKFLYWEFPSYNGQQAVRMGKWKGVRKNIFDGNLNIELYDLEKDAQELNDLSEIYPEIVQQMEEIMSVEHSEAENNKFKFVQLGDNKK